MPIHTFCQSVQRGPNRYEVALGVWLVSRYLGAGPVLVKWCANEACNKIFLVVYGGQTLST